MTIQEKLNMLAEMKDPSLKMNRILTDRAIAEAILKMESVPGIKGDDGYTPVKGKDYFTEEEIANFVNYLATLVKDGETPVKGQDYFTEEEINSIVSKVKSLVPDGQTPIRGIDYWTPEDKSKIENDIKKLIPTQPKEKNNEEVQKLIDKSIETIVKENKDNGLKLSAFEKRLIRLGGGGASFMSQLIDVAIGAQTNGQALIWNATSSKWVPGTTGGGFTILPATGSVNSVNLAFTLTIKPTIIVSDGAMYRENVGWTWNAGTLTATMIIPPNNDIFGIQ